MDDTDYPLEAPITYVWECIDTEVQSPCFTKWYQYLPLSNSNTQSIPAEAMLPGAEYKFTLTVIDHISQTSDKLSFSMLSTADEVIDVSIVSEADKTGYLELSRGQWNVFKAFPDYETVQDVTNITFKWSVWTASQNQLVEGTHFISDFDSCKVDNNFLVPGEYYKVYLEITDGFNAGKCWRKYRTLKDGLNF